MEHKQEFTLEAEEVGLAIKLYLENHKGVKLPAKVYCSVHGVIKYSDGKFRQTFEFMDRT